MADTEGVDDGVVEELAQDQAVPLLPGDEDEKTELVIHVPEETAKTAEVSVLALIFAIILIAAAVVIVFVVLDRRRQKRIKECMDKLDKTEAGTPGAGGSEGEQHLLPAGPQIDALADTTTTTTEDFPDSDAHTDGTGDIPVTRQPSNHNDSNRNRNRNRNAKAAPKSGSGRCCMVVCCPRDKQEPSLEDVWRQKKAMQKNANACKSDGARRSLRLMEEGMTYMEGLNRLRRDPKAVCSANVKGHSKGHGARKAEQGRRRSQSLPPRAKKSGRRSSTLYPPGQGSRSCWSQISATKWEKQHASLTPEGHPRNDRLRSGHRARGHDEIEYISRSQGEGRGQGRINQNHQRYRRSRSLEPHREGQVANDPYRDYEDGKDQGHSQGHHRNHYHHHHHPQHRAVSYDKDGGVHNRSQNQGLRGSLERSWSSFSPGEEEEDGEGEGDGGRRGSSSGDWGCRDRERGDRRRQHGDPQKRCSRSHGVTRGRPNAIATAAANAAAERHGNRNQSARLPPPPPPAPPSCRRPQHSTPLSRHGPRLPTPLYAHPHRDHDDDDSGASGHRSYRTLPKTYRPDHRSHGAGYSLQYPSSYRHLNVSQNYNCEDVSGDVTAEAPNGRSSSAAAKAENGHRLAEKGGEEEGDRLEHDKIEIDFRDDQREESRDASQRELAGKASHHLVLVSRGAAARLSPRSWRRRRRERRRKARLAARRVARGNRTGTDSSSDTADDTVSLARRLFGLKLTARRRRRGRRRRRLRPSCGEREGSGANRPLLGADHSPADSDDLTLEAGDSGCGVSASLHSDPRAEPSSPTLRHQAARGTPTTGNARGRGTDPRTSDSPSAGGQDPSSPLYSHDLLTATRVLGRSDLHNRKRPTHHLSRQREKRAKAGAGGCWRGPGHGFTPDQGCCLSSDDDVAFRRLAVERWCEQQRRASLSTLFPPTAAVAGRGLGPLSEDFASKLVVHDSPHASGRSGHQPRASRENNNSSYREEDENESVDARQHSLPGLQCESLSGKECEGTMETKDPSTDNCAFQLDLMDFRSSFSSPIDRTRKMSGPFSSDRSNDFDFEERQCDVESHNTRRLNDRSPHEQEPVGQSKHGGEGRSNRCVRNTAVLSLRQEQPWRESTKANLNSLLQPPSDNGEMPACLPRRGNLEEANSTEAREGEGPSEDGVLANDSLSLSVLPKSAFNDKS